MTAVLNRWREEIYEGVYVRWYNIMYIVTLVEILSRNKDKLPESFVVYIKDAEGIEGETIIPISFSDMDNCTLRVLSKEEAMVEML